jgi:hypothetical protein
MIFYSMVVFGLGWCVGGLVNEWYRRRHPYFKTLVYSPGTKTTYDIQPRHRLSYRRTPVVRQVDPSPQPKPTHAD